MSPSSQGPRATLEDIARVAGTSKSTVSRALSNSLRIAPVTRSRILRIANELNYRPDPALSAIAKSRWRTSSPRQGWSILYLQSKSRDRTNAERCRRFAESLGFHLDSLDLHHYATAAQVDRILRARNIRGALIGPIPDPSTTIALDLDFARIAVVCCGLGRTHPPTDVITWDHFENVRGVWAKARADGHRRIGVILMRHVPMAEDDVARDSAARFELEATPRRNRIPILTISQDCNDSSGIRRWATRYAPDAVLAFPASLGNAVCSIPKPAIYSLVGHPHTRYHDATLERAAIEHLVSLIRANQTGLPEIPKRILLPTGSMRK